MNLIDKDKLIEQLEKEEYEITDSNGELCCGMSTEDFERIIEAQATVNEWIPVNERLPECTDDYAVIVGINALGLGMSNERRTALYNTVHKRWYVHEDTTQCIIGEVIAWKPIESYIGNKE